MLALKHRHAWTSTRVQRCRVRRARVVRNPTHRAWCTASPNPSEPGDVDTQNSATTDLPPELQDLAINEDGFLIDTKTGKVINEMGATRFDVAVRALRGELDPPEWAENSERSPGVILSALYQFPRSYLFQVVGRLGPRSAPQAAVPPSGTAAAAAPAPEAAPVCGKAAFVGDVTATIARVTQSEVEEAKVEVKERMGGKYVSIAVDVLVRAPELVSMVYDELAKDSRVIMKF